MIFDYDISLATPNDIPGILALQEPNLPDSGGSLSVRLTADWFKNAIRTKAIAVQAIDATYLDMYCRIFASSSRGL
jgi:hypothetical protein